MSMNIKIKAFAMQSEHPRVATEKFFLRGPVETSKGCRWLEPGEVVTIPDDEEAKYILSRGQRYVELTLEPATRPLYFSSECEGLKTSSFAPANPGRANAAKAAMKNVYDEMQAESSKATEREAYLRSREDELAAREAAIAAREAEVVGDAGGELDSELADYVPINNVNTPKEIENAREEGKAEEKKIAKAKTKRPRRNANA